jgi:membrane protein involved in colicin uptake
MGRKKLNRTKEELLEQQRQRSKRHYQRHKQRLNEQSMQRYWQNNRNIQDSEQG